MPHTCRDAIQELYLAVIDNNAQYEHLGVADKWLLRAVMSDFVHEYFQRFHRAPPGVDQTVALMFSDSLESLGYRSLTSDMEREAVWEGEAWLMATKKGRPVRNRVWDGLDESVESASKNFPT